jgi:hypothetical protein
MLIVAADVTTQSTDYGQLVGMIDQTTENIGAAPAGVLGNASYFRAENIAAMEEKGSRRSSRPIASPIASVGRRRVSRRT